MLANYNGVMIEHKKKRIFCCYFDLWTFHFLSFYTISDDLYASTSKIFLCPRNLWALNGKVCFMQILSSYIFACWIFLAIFNQYPNPKKLCIFKEENVLTNKSLPLSITLLCGLTKYTILHGSPKFHFRWKDYFMRE